MTTRGHCAKDGPIVAEAQGVRILPGIAAGDSLLSRQSK